MCGICKSVEDKYIMCVIYLLNTNCISRASSTVNNLFIIDVNYNKLWQHVGLLFKGENVISVSFMVWLPCHKRSASWDSARPNYIHSWAGTSHAGGILQIMWLAGKRRSFMAVAIIISNTNLNVVGHNYKSCYYNYMCI